ncbi:MAG TPA: gamma-glutamylcyclotransferase family protein [Skermanella sp.]|jgi:hypothetical protein|nr:gamma-glutamylcyclotransferase family protein [Skermanella sp.]
MTTLALKTLIALATGYPYEFPACSYLFADHARHPLPAGILGELTGRIPVIACGSNRAPEQLARKFQDWPLPLRIPVLCAKLAGFDVVYSAHFTRYGAVPATLHPCPGATVDVAVQWLTPAELERMDATEGIGINYDRRHLTGIDLQIEGFSTVHAAETYLSRRGPLIDRDTPIALEAIPCAGRAWPALNQHGVLDLARRRLAPDTTLDSFIHAIVTDADYRLRLTELLAKAA